MEYTVQWLAHNEQSKRYHNLIKGGPKGGIIQTAKQHISKQFNVLSIAKRLSFVLFLVMSLREM